MFRPRKFIARVAALDRASADLRRHRVNRPQSWKLTSDEIAELIAWNVTCFSEQMVTHPLPKIPNRKFAHEVEQFCPAS
jgi:hypothetical protein